MKLPAESQLSREQKEVIAAPTEGTILVMGPPGSGKTVVAMLRERALKKRREQAALVVFNQRADPVHWKRSHVPNVAERLVEESDRGILSGRTTATTRTGDGHGHNTTRRLSTWLLERSAQL